MSLIVKSVQAATITTQNDDVATLQGFEGLFENIITAVLGFAGIALFIMFLIGGFRLITSGDNPKAAEAANKTLTSAVGGMILIASAFLILRFIETITGAGVTTFRVLTP